MVATVGIYQANGGSDGSPLSENEITTSTRLQTADQFAPADLTYPVPIPASGWNYSYWIHVYLKITGGTFTKINNVKFWSDGSIDWTLGTGGELRVGNRDTGDIGCPMPTNYEVATGTQGETGHAIEDGVNGHTYYNGQTTPTQNVANFTSTNKATVDTTDHTTTGDCKAVVLQVKVGSDATQGEQPDETLYFSYDEI